MERRSEILSSKIELMTQDAKADSDVELKQSRVDNADSGTRAGEIMI
jgi:hypothetical protein